MMVDLPEPIRLIIWDLDDTFWKGTLTEGGIEAFIQEHHDLVPALAQRGIMSAICSKNDHDRVRAILQEQGLWDYFIFPSIDWSPKGPRIAAMVEAIGLRPPTIMFIDDNPNNRAEVAATVPGIVVASEDFIGSIAGHAMFAGKDDSAMTRLAQYKLLERKKQDEVQASGDNIGFLRGCDIRVTIEHDLEKHIDRVVELINRTNQLNFTKQRLPEDLAEARIEALKQVRYFGHQAGLVNVSDRYGEYGFVGFYLKTLDEGLGAGSLKHFCFSCRTLGMGIEQWVYQTLGRPWLHPVGDVLSDVHGAKPVDWINQAGGGAASGRRLGQFAEIRLRGGCEISALAHYFKVAGPVTCVETNFPRDIFVIKLDTPASLINLVQGGQERLAALAKLDFPPESLRSAFYGPVSGPTLLVLNLWGELHIPMYRHRDSGFFAHLVVSGFMGWGETYAGGDIAAWTDEALAAQADASNLDPAVRARLFDIVAELRRNYVFAGQVDEAQVKANLRVIADHVPAGATLALVLPSCWSFDGSANKRNTDHARWCREELASRPNVELIDIDRCIQVPAERSAEMGDHFDRIVYYRVAEEIMARVTALERAA
jgi:FkbH-like protein